MLQRIPSSSTKVSGAALLPARSWNEAQKGPLLHAWLSPRFPPVTHGGGGEQELQVSLWAGGLRDGAAACSDHAYGELVSGESVSSCATS